MKRISKWLNHRLSNIVNTKRSRRKGKAMMSSKSPYISLSTLFGFMLMMCALSGLAVGQRTQVRRQPPSSKRSQIRPVPVEHLYWYFLLFQNHIDTRAAELDAQGKNGTVMRNHLQRSLGWSDADFTPIHAASVRLAAKAKDLHAKNQAIIAAGKSSSSPNQLRVLASQRDVALNAEVSYLRSTLPPDKVVAFEAFLARLFSQPTATPPPASGNTPGAPAAVQP
jgi:hypothetical protein